MEIVASEEAPAFVFGGLNAVNYGIFNYRDGQVFNLGDEIVFEGHAVASTGGDQVVSVEYSLDLGQTWITLDTSGSDGSRYIYWYFTFKPESIGSYVLQVRATDAFGTPAALPVQSLFHVE